MEETCWQGLIITGSLRNIVKISSICFWQMGVLEWGLLGNTLKIII